MLAKKFTPPSVCRSSVILVQEGIKFLIASFMLYSSGNFKPAISDWTISSWLQVAFLPAALYSVQNLAALLAYQNLDALTFNVLNQTKTLSAALCCYLVIGRKQSKAQIAALFLLLTSALVIEKVIKIDALFSLIAPPSPPTLPPPLEEEVKKANIFQNVFKGFGKKAEIPEVNNPASEAIETVARTSRHLTHGVAPVLLASFISGLAGALSQKNLQSSGGKDKKKSNGRNSYLFTMELCAASYIFLFFTLLRSDDGQFISENGFFYNWNVHTLIPIVSNALGGIIVGLVTKYAGSVRKGFALIFGILLSGILQAMIGIGEDVENSGGSGVSKEQIVGGIMAGISLWAHATHPYTSPSVVQFRIPASQEIPESTVVSEKGNFKPTKRSNRKARKED